MRNIRISDFNQQGISYDLQCGEIKCEIDTTTFQYTANYHNLNVANFGFMELDETFVPQTLSFKAIAKQGYTKKVKEFMRGDKTYILSISVDNDPKDIKHVLVKKTNEKIKQIATTDYDEVEFEFVTMSHYIKVKNQVFELGGEELETSFFATSTSDSNPNQNLDGYIYGDNFVYGSSEATVESFIFDLLPNYGDRKMYMKWTLQSFLSDPAIGINNNAENTYKAYKPIDIITSDSISHNLIVNSYPLLKEISLKAKVALANDQNIEDMRDFSKESYLTIEYGDKEPRAFLKNIYNGRIEYYEQYENL